MNKLGEIIVVDDDLDDRDLICELCKELNVPNKVFCFNSVGDALSHLRGEESDPFFILSDLHMPVIDGFGFKQVIQADAGLVNKGIPFILYSIGTHNGAFNKALSLGVQGFLIKPSTYPELRACIELVIKYMNLAMGNPVTPSV